MARCWVLRKRAGLVLLSLVVCAVRMLAGAGGVGSSLFLGLLLRSWFWVRLVVLSPACGVRVVSGALGLGCGGWLGPLGIEPLCWLRGSGLSGLGLGFPVG